MTDSVKTTDEQLLRKALKWALASGAKASDIEPHFKSYGCGCCSYSLDPPEEVDAVVRAIRFELIAEKQL